MSTQADARTAHLRHAPFTGRPPNCGMRGAARVMRRGEGRPTSRTAGSSVDAKPQHDDESYPMSFTLLRHIDVNDAGIMRRVGLYHGDIAAIPAEHRVDLLVVSAFPNDYLETPASLIGALGRAGLSVGRLAQDKAIDLRATSGFWLSKPLGPLSESFQAARVACFEPLTLGVPESVVGHLFRGLFPFLDFRNESTVAMPLLATGDQRRPPERMLTAILDAATHWFGRGLPMRELKIVTHDASRLDTLVSTMDDFVSAQGEPSSQTKPDGFPYDVFLSFSSKDGDDAAQLRQLLEHQTTPDRVFDFRLKIDPGQCWQHAIDDAISNSRLVVPLLTPDYFASPECQEELMQARLRHKHSDTPVLFPIYWRNAGETLALWLQVINLLDCRESSFTKLQTAIQNLGLPGPTAS